MSELIKVSDLKAELEGLPDDLPVFVFDEHTDEAFPLQIIDPTISDRVDLNFSSEEENKVYRVNVTVHHSFTVVARNEDEAHYEASENVLWDDHISDIDLTVKEED